MGMLLPASPVVTRIESVKFLLPLQESDSSPLQTLPILFQRFLLFLNVTVLWQKLDGKIRLEKSKVNRKLPKMNRNKLFTFSKSSTGVSIYI